MAIFISHVKVISRERAQRGGGRRLSLEPRGCTTSGSTATMTSPTRRRRPFRSDAAGEARPSIWRPRKALERGRGREKRKDAQLAREVEFAIPREMTRNRASSWRATSPQAEFVEKGMIADLNVHWDIGADGSPSPMPMSCSPCAKWTRTGSARRCATGTHRDGRAMARTLGRSCQRAPGRTRHRRADRSSQP
jgi:hypothetical protein